MKNLQRKRGKKEKQTQALSYARARVLNSPLRVNKEQNEKVTQLREQLEKAG